jgi:hypothetical protein
MFSLNHLISLIRTITVVFLLSLLPASGHSAEPANPQSLGGQPIISLLEPEDKDGKGYRLTYRVDVPLEVFWKFKTDFDNEFLMSNALILSHRLISHSGNVVVTENRYSTKPGTVFRWQTTVFPEQHLLKFILLNPQETDQKYHYGHIQLEGLDQKTKVTQVAYFDFFGASFWVNYPFYGGLQHFLKHTAKWEQDIIQDLKDRYN